MLNVLQRVLDYFREELSIVSNSLYLFLIKVKVILMHYGLDVLTDVSIGFILEDAFVHQLDCTQY